MAKEVEFGQIENCFRFLKSSVADYQKVISKPSRLLYYSLLALSPILRVLGVSFFVKSRLKAKLDKTNARDRSLGIVLTENHLTVVKSLKSIGLSFPYVSFGLGSSDSEGECLSVGMLEVLLLSLSQKNFSKIVKASWKNDLLIENIPRVVRIIGLSEIYRLMFDASGSIINFNDHSPDAVLAADMAICDGLKTIYFQHAPVSEGFPGLYHDVNIIFSEDSLTKYSGIARDGVEVVKFCDVRFLSASTEKSLGSEGCVLICPNALDGREEVISLIRELVSRYTVILRPHPHDKRKWPAISGCEVSTNRGIWDDLSKCELVVANESAVVLEALYAKKKVYKASFLSASLDSYGFLKKGLLIKEHFNQSTLVSAIERSDVEYDIDKLGYFIGEPKAPSSAMIKKIDSLTRV